MRPNGARRALGFMVGSCLLAWCASAHAYRPFVSTDAAVAEPKAVEIELGYFTLRREATDNTFLIPNVVLNYGLWRSVERASPRFAPRPT